MARGNGFEVRVLSDTEQFERGIRSGVIDPLEDADKALEQLSDAAEGAGRDAGRGLDKLEDALKDAQRQAGRTEDAVEDIGNAGRDAGREVERGMRNASDGIDDMKDEAKQSVRETAASFSDITDAVDFVQEVAANAFVGFGPAGVAAGAAAAIGIGAAVAGFDAVNEANEESQKRAAVWADAFIEAGGRVLTFDQQMAKVRSIITDPEMYKEAETNAKNWGVSFDTAVSAMAGSASALAEAHENLAAKEADAARESVKLADGGEALADMLVGATAEANAGRTALNALTGEMEKGAQGADAMSRIMIDAARSTAGATEAVDEFGDTVITLPGGKQVYIDAETGQATQDVDAIEKQIYGIKDKDVQVRVRANLGAAAAAYDKWIRDHDGRSIKIHARVIAPVEGWNG